MAKGKGKKKDGDKTGQPGGSGGDSAPQPGGSGGNAGGAGHSGQQGSQQMPKEQPPQNKQQPKGNKPKGPDGPATVDFTPPAQQQQQAPPPWGKSQAPPTAAQPAPARGKQSAPQQKQQQQQQKPSQSQSAPQQQKPTPQPQKQPPKQSQQVAAVTENLAAVSVSGAAAHKQTRSPSISSTTSTSTTHSTVKSGAADGSGERESRPMFSLNIPTAAAMPLAPPKGPGKKGRPVKIDVNYLLLNIQKLISTCYHYDINIEPNMPKRFMPFVFEEFRRKNFPQTFLAFDGQKNAISPVVLKTENVERQVVIPDPDNATPRTYMVAIKQVKDSSAIDLKVLSTYQTTRQFDLPLRAMQALEIILKSVFLSVKGVQCGRSFFMRPEKPVDLSGGYELWTGLFQSAVLGSRPYLNVDIAHKAFPLPMNLVDVFRNTGANLNNEIDYRCREGFISHMKGLRITYEMPGQNTSTKCYKFNDLGATPQKTKFKNEEGREQTVFDYFRTVRKYTIKFPNLPCIVVGNSLRTISLPAELCTVSANQAVMRKCNEEQTRHMIRESATSTDLRKQKIMNILSKIAHNSSKCLNQFGLSVANDFTQIPARILDPPMLEYSGNKTAKPQKGVWNPAGTFLFPKNIENWAIFCLDARTNDNALYNIGNKISVHGSRCNMMISTKFTVERPRNDRGMVQDQEIDRLMKLLIDRQCQLLVCVIPDRGDFYARVKQAAEIRCGILTQCIKAGTVYRKGTDDSTINNILLKINAKMNGTNHKLSASAKVPAMGKPFMVIGADVTHPSPDQTRIPSVVGVAASYDINAFKYNINWRLQNPKQEMIQDFDQILQEHLRFFFDKNKCYPQHIFYYRDGVSEGQFQEVMRVELSAMYRAYQAVNPTVKPKITFMVVQKRHHTRFFPGRSGISQDKNNNVPAGTIVDSEITHPNETQFFLVSHQSIQGVAKPTKYCLLRDDNNMTMDELQSFTYSLCHMFTRCNRSVSYPAPTYYAHLVAYRGRVYIEGRNAINMGNLAMEYKNRTIKDCIIKDHPMYFV